MLKRIGNEKWIHKYCAAGKHYVVATPEHFRVADKKLTTDCKECEARQSPREYADNCERVAWRSTH
jgi:hypothetical protein